jgi:adenylate kinase family enzyme
MEKILIIGCPGAGKGTQAELLKKYGFYKISIGDIIRASKDPKIVRHRDEECKKGDLLSDYLIFEILKKEIFHLPKSAKGYLLDGAVRTLPQAKYVKNNSIVKKVIYLNLSKETAIKRLLNRNQGRIDDNLKIIKHRFEEFNKKTLPVLSYLKKNFEFYEINAELNIDEIHKELVSKLNLV